MRLRQQQLRWQTTSASLDVALQVGQANVQSQMVAALRDGDEVVKAHVLLRDTLAADVALPAVALVDEPRVDLLVGDLSQTCATPASTFEMRRPVFIRMLLSPRLVRCVMAILVRFMPGKRTLLPALATLRTEARRAETVTVKLARSLRRATASALYFRRHFPELAPIVAVTKPPRLTFHPTLLSAVAGREEGKRTAPAFTEMIAQHGRLLAPMVRRTTDLPPTRLVHQ